jgi:transcriptional regulator with XRE-family HTH domain
MKTISDFLKNQMQKKGLTMYRLAKDSGVDQTSIQMYVNATRQPSAENFIKICKGINASKSDILELFEK